MLTEREEIIAKIKEKLHNSSFNVKCGLEIEKVECGKMTLAMKVADDMTNPYGMAHGGALATLMDTCVGVTCLTLGKNVVTLNMTTNYLKSAPQGCTVRATSNIIHNGRTTVVGEVTVVDDAGNLIAKASATFFVIKHDPDIPAQW